MNCIHTHVLIFCLFDGRDIVPPVYRQFLHLVSGLNTSFLIKEFSHLFGKDLLSIYFVTDAMFHSLINCFLFCRFSFSHSIHFFPIAQYSLPVKNQLNGTKLKNSPPVPHSLLQLLVFILLLRAKHL